MEKRTKIIIAISSAIVLTGAGILIVKQIKKAKTKKDQEAEDAADEAARSAAPTTYPSSSGASDKFPLGKGSKGNNVKNLQSYLGLDADGSFGAKTESALKAKTGKYTVDSQSELDRLNPKYVTPSQATQTQNAVAPKAPARFIMNRAYVLKTDKNVAAYKRDGVGKFRLVDSSFSFDAMDKVEYWGTNLNNKLTFTFNSFKWGQIWFNLNDSDLLS